MALASHSSSRSYVGIPVYLKGSDGEGDGIDTRLPQREGLLGGGVHGQISGYDGKNALCIPHRYRAGDHPDLNRRLRQSRGPSRRPRPRRGAL